MTIPILIDKQDTSELVRDQIAAILLVESQSQMALATAAGKDPELWRLRVFSERSNPWADFIDAPDNGTEDAAPIVNVAFDNETFDGAASNVVERQKAVATFNVDVYGYGKSASQTVGHVVGDAKAAFEAQRGMRLVRNILMAGEHTYLGMRGVVWRRFPQSITAFQPKVDKRPVQNIVAMRLGLEVQFNEFSPQVTGETLELVSLRVNRDVESGELLMLADFPIEE
jgi:hypothetical protein